jgi:hypothetical protein
MTKKMLQKFRDYGHDNDFPQNWTADSSTKNGFTETNTGSKDK